MSERPIAVDLFAGAGGMTLGFEQAGFDVLASVELDPIHCATHEFNFPFWKVLCMDVVHLGGADIRHLSMIGDNEIDVVFGGPPCQGFSLIGKRSIDDPRNALVFHFMRLVLELNPKYFVMENVAGLAIGQHKKFLTEIIEYFSNNGYAIRTPYAVLNAAHFGVPQDRKRLFLIGSRAYQNLPSYPKVRTFCAEPGTIRAIVRQGLKKGPSVWDAIGDLPNLENYPELLDQDWATTTLGSASAYAMMLRGDKRSVDDFSFDRECDPSILTSSLRTVHTELSRQRFKATPQGAMEPISRFHKLHPMGICNTIRAGTASNRGAFTSPRPIHPYEPRCITVREAARLHSYPDWFRFHVTKWHGFRQIGNSVPPLLARSVASEIMGALGVKATHVAGKRKLGDPQLLSFTMGEAAEYYGVHSHAIEPRTRGGMMVGKKIDVPEERMGRYDRIIVEIFKRHYQEGIVSFEFKRKEIEDIANEFGIKLPKNIGDNIYSYRFRKSLPDEITSTAPSGTEWIIELAGRGNYRFRLCNISHIIPRSNLAWIKIPDSTPEIIMKYALNDEQALLAKVRYNRLIDTFLGITTYSMQNHLRTTVKDIGQIEIDEIYVGLNRKGTQFIVPVQAKGGSDRVGIVQASQDILCCREKFPQLLCRPVAVQFMSENIIAMFELVQENNEIRVVDEKHYELVAADNITDSDLLRYRASE